MLKPGIASVGLKCRPGVAQGDALKIRSQSGAGSGERWPTGNRASRVRIVASPLHGTTWGEDATFSSRVIGLIDPYQQST